MVLASVTESPAKGKDVGEAAEVGLLEIERGFDAEGSERVREDLLALAIARGLEVSSFGSPSEYFL